MFYHVPKYAANLCYLARKRRVNCEYVFARRRTITSVTITKDNGGQIARESGKIRKKLRLGPYDPPSYSHLSVKVITYLLAITH